MFLTMHSTVKYLLTLPSVVVIVNEHDVELKVSLTMHSTMKYLLTLYSVLVITNEHDVELSCMSFPDSATPSSIY